MTLRIEMIDLQTQAIPIASGLKLKFLCQFEFRIMGDWNRMSLQVSPEGSKRFQNNCSIIPS